MEQLDLCTGSIRAVSGSIHPIGPGRAGQPGNTSIGVGQAEARLCAHKLSSAYERPGQDGGEKETCPALESDDPRGLTWGPGQGTGRSLGAWAGTVNSVNTLRALTILLLSHCFPRHLFFKYNVNC